MPSIRLDNPRGCRVDFRIWTYWDDPNREPFILRVDGELAGFALVIKGDADTPHEMGEFFVLQKCGGKGVGTSAAQQLFGMFPRNWLINEMWNHYKAQDFWRSVVNAYTNGHCEEHYDAQRRPFQKFSTQNR